ncbi:MAG: hypothetical protein JWQ78_75, partial [Sediminibacterium sp.]|nr:hypothetical protein [Sediminibacterium sp.]
CMHPGNHQLFAGYKTPGEETGDDHGERRSDADKLRVFHIQLRSAGKPITFRVNRDRTKSQVVYQFE